MSKELTCEEIRSNFECLSHSFIPHSFKSDVPLIFFSLETYIAIYGLDANICSDHVGFKANCTSIESEFAFEEQKFQIK